MRARAAGVIAMICWLPGAGACFTSDAVITVRPDGSGRFEQTIVVRPGAVTEFEKLTGLDAANRTTPESIWTEIQKRAQSARVYEPRVTPLNDGDTMGVRLSYDFQDVTSLSEADLVPQLPGTGSFWKIASPDPVASTRLRFTLEPLGNGLERLTVHFPRFRVDPATEPPSAWVSGSPAEMAALKKLMSGARVAITIASHAPIVRANTPFRNGNRVTLLDVDIAEALFSPEVQRMAATPGTFDELLSWLSTVPGVTLAPDHDIAVEFANPSTEQRPPAPQAAQSSADTEVFVASLAVSDEGLVVGPPVNISNDPGYDNQPFFSPDGAQIFFTSSRGAGAEAHTTAIPKTDIFRYEIASRRLFRITQTPESEFSPTVMPDGRRLSMVRVEADGTQHLCNVEPSGVPARQTLVMLPNVKPVGYHAWIDARSVALYVLGLEGQPSTLQVASLEDGSARTVATNIGRSVQKMPSGHISFVQRETAGDGAVTAILKELNPATLEVRTLVKAVAGLTDPYVAWMPDGSALMASGSTLYRWRSRESDWMAVAHLDGFGLHDVTRLAVNQQGTRLAIVARK